MLIIAFFLLVLLLSLAAFFASRLLRPARIPASDAYSMKAALERRLQEGADLRF